MLPKSRSKRTRESVKSLEKRQKVQVQDLIEVQEDFAILLEGFPLLSKFTNPECFQTIEFFSNINRLAGADNNTDEDKDNILVFHIEISENEEVCSVTITPQFQDEIAKTSYEENRQLYGILQQYIHHQLLQSGIIWELRDLKSIPQFDLWIIPRQYNNIEELAFDFAHTSFHTDTSLFNMINYISTNNDPVLGTEILFTDHVHHSNNITGVYTDPTIYDEKTYGKIALIQNQISELYTGHSPPATTLRGLYNSGSTMAWCDMLVMHSQPKLKETFEDNILTVSFVASDEEKRVSVCVDRIKATVDHYKHRNVIIMGIAKTGSDFGLIYEAGAGESFTLQFVRQPIDIPTVNFSMDAYGAFLRNLSTNHCHIFSDKTIERKIRKFGGTRKYKKQKRRSQFRYFRRRSPI